ncbi:hypothetical protein D3C80_628190 [compost metagenome]
MEQRLLHRILGDPTLAYVIDQRFEALGLLQAQGGFQVILRVILQHLVAGPYRVFAHALAPQTLLLGIEYALVARLHAVVNGMDVLLDTGDPHGHAAGIDLGVDLVIDQQELVEILWRDQASGTWRGMIRHDLAKVVGDQCIAMGLGELIDNRGHCTIPFVLNLFNQKGYSR